MRNHGRAVAVIVAASLIGGVPPWGVPAAHGAAADELQQAFIETARRIGPSVVSISVEHTELVRFRRFGFGGGPEDEFFDRFFSDFFGDSPERELKTRGVGSGLIVDPEGYILTNEHVVGNADKLLVTLPDGREFKAEVKGADSTSDLAIIKIKAKNLPVAEFGDSDTVQIGQWAIAVGNPFGFAVGSSEPTVTVGVVSALNRAIAAGRDRSYTNLIQTDAAINPGNSGGPLADLSGKIIGINVAIFSTSGGYQGIGFAVPSNTARAVIGDLIQGKEVVYGWLGINVQDLNDNLGEFFGVPDRRGVVVARVLQGGPAEQAGLRDGDIIRTYQGQSVKNVRELLGQVNRMKVGTKVALELVRDKKPMKVTVEIGERPRDMSGLAPRAPKAWRGLEVSEMTEELAQRFRVPERHGVVVTHVESGSPSDEAGLRVGDVINEINRQPVKTLEDYLKATSAAGGGCLIRTHRGYAIVKPEAR